MLFDADCPITGQEYDEVAAQCPKTCTNPHLLCVGEGQPGCSCPKGQLIDEMNNHCVHPDNCPSKSERRENNGKCGEKKSKVIFLFIYHRA